MDGKLHCDPRRRPGVVKLPLRETERRWRETTPQWPIMHAVLDGVTRDQMMARHKANHIQVVYALTRKGSASRPVHQGLGLAELGLEAHLCGNLKKQHLDKLMKITIKPKISFNFGFTSAVRPPAAFRW